MKNFKNLLTLVSILAALTFTVTSCSKTGDTDEGDETEAVDGAEAGADASDGDAAGAEGDADGDAADGDGTEANAGGSYAWSSSLNDWIASGEGMTSITLDGIGDEESGITEAGQAQLDALASILAANEGVNAVIKGHTTADQKIGNGGGRAKWAKVKLLLNYGGIAARVKTEGVGADEPIDGVDANDPSQKRLTVGFSK